MTFKSLIVWASFVVVGLGSGACGTSSPTAPGQSSTDSPVNPARGSATISGSVAGGAVSSIAGFRSITGPGLTVTVVGTDINALVSGSGSFVLTNVPTGNIQLRFSGPGTDAVVTVTGVSDGDDIRITVAVSGNTALLHNVSRKSQENTVEIEGSVVSGTCASFVVKGTTIVTNTVTAYSHGTCANVVPGTLVEVKGTRQSDGSILASKVEFEDDDDEEIELEGRVTAGGCGSFTVRGIVVTTNATTQFKDGRCDEIAIGVLVHVKATRTVAGTVLATRVSIEQDDDDDDDEEDDDEDDDDDDDDDEEDDEDDDEIDRRRR